MFGKRLIRPMLGQPPTAGACTLLLAACLAGCKVYDAARLRDPGGPPDAGQSGTDAGTRVDSGPIPCVPAAETCNAVDDDCDGFVDEDKDTRPFCESIIVNADTKCVPVGPADAPQAACVQLKCRADFDDCDGRPQNGCEKPFCSCNDCGDAGADGDGDGGA